MQTTPENIRRASEMIEAWRAVNRGFEIPPPVAKTLTLALLELPTLELVARCVDELLHESERLPTPADIHAWRRANAPRRRDCPHCGGSGNVAWKTIETERLGPQLVFARCECTRRGRHPQEAA